MTFNLKSVVNLFGICLCCLQLEGQIQPYFKTGVNFGFINKDTWEGSGSSDIYKYGSPLIRPIVSVGLVQTTNKFKLSAGLMYQTKGQGSKVPRVRDFFQTISPDILHFISFPAELELMPFQKIGIGLAIQPSLYIGGVDNYSSGEYWRGWIWSGVLGIKYSLSKKISLGFEYEYDLNLYYCPECDTRFLTYRLFTAIPIGKTLDKKHTSSYRKK